MSDVILHHGDALAILPTMEAESIDAIVTDPPYGTHVERDGYGRRHKWQGNQRIAGDEDLSLFAASLPLMRPLVKPDGWVIFFSSPKRRDEVGSICRDADLTVYDEVVWDKKSPGLGGGIRYQHESILLCSFGCPVGRCGLPSVLPEWVPKGQYCHRQQYHVHEKPVGVLSKLVCYATDEGDLILDPFAGSGSTLVACQETGRRCVGIECDEQYIPVARQRLKEAERPMFFRPTISQAPLF